MMGVPETPVTLSLFSGPIDEWHTQCPRCASHALYWSDFIECDVCGFHIAYACTACRIWWDCVWPEAAQPLDDS